MKKKLIALLALVCMTLTASAEDVPTYSLTKATDAEAHGTITFKVGGNAVTSAQEGQTVTVTVTPATGWTVNQPSGQWIAAIAATPRRTGIDLLSEVTLTPVAGQTNQWTFTMQRANAEISMTYKKLLTNTDITIEDISALTYTGVAQTPTVTVKDGTTPLVLNTDYTVSYSNNVNAALSTATTAPTVTITAVATSEKYAGETTKTFTINKKALEDDFIADIDALTYTGEALTPEPVVTYNGMTLAKGTDFTYSYENNVNAGTATVTITAVADGNYSGTASKTFTISPKALENSMIQDIADQTYTGEALTPAVTVTDGTTMLTLNTDYIVSYANNVNAGTATVTITATENSNYSGSASKRFTINQAQGSVLFYPWQVEKTFGDEDFTYIPYTTGDGTLTYSSEDESVAVVDVATGKVSIKGVGRVWIYAWLSATENYTAVSDYYELTVNPKEIEYEGGDVTQDQNGYTVTLTEDPSGPSAQPLPDDEDLAGLTYSRTLTAPGSSEGDATVDDQPANLFTICVPFAPETGTAVKYYTLSGVSGETLNFSEVETPVANTPYLVAVTGSVNFTEDCTDQEVASMEIASTTKDGYTFTGTFTGLKNAKSVGKYILQKGNKWGKVTAEKQNVYIPPFRAYVEAPATAAPQLNATIGDGNTTGIQNIRTVDQDGTEHWYDLSGKRIATPEKGVYILNGKKVVVK